MRSRLRTAGRAALGLSLSLALASKADEGWFVTVEGARVRIPAIEGMDCGRMARVLRDIDATGYRKGKAMPYHPGDMALYDYEDRLAAAHFKHCAREPDPMPLTSDDDATFKDGYE